MLRRLFLKLAASTPFVLSGTESRSFHPVDEVRRQIADSFGIPIDKLPLEFSLGELCPFPENADVPDSPIDWDQDLAIVDLHFELEQRFEISILGDILSEWREMTPAQLAQLVGKLLEDHDLSRQLTRQRLVENLIFSLRRIPDNHPPANHNSDPTSVARAVNQLITLERDIADEAISQFAHQSSERNNLETLAYVLLSPTSAVSLAPQMRLKDGLIFFVGFPTKVQSIPAKSSNVKIYETIIKNAEFRRTSVLLPQDPMPTLLEILANVDEALKRTVVHQLIIAAGGNYELIEEDCKTTQDLIDKIASIGFKLDTETTQYFFR